MVRLVFLKVMSWKGLNKITLSISSECSITLDRNEIEEIAEKDGMWFITIDAEVISCK